MLSGDILSQLSDLKKDIRDSRDLAQGTVRGTSGRYGFVKLDDGRDVFLPPNEMDRVFHDDRVEVLVTTNIKKKDGEEKEQSQGKVEKLLYSPLKQLAGRYCIKGKGHFVIVEYPQHSRWIFVPPNARANTKDGHYVSARITQHPYENGKAQAKITHDLGTETDINMIRKYNLALFQLHDGFGKEAIEQVKNLQQQAIADGNTPSKQARANLRDIPFVTIDSASTRDMDDALAITTTETGWKLQVAIADPSCEIEWDSPIDHIALLRVNSVYLPGKPVPMIPDELSTERYSLVSGQDRLALVATLDVENSGKVTGYQFEPAIIQSKAKLSYQQVAALLANNHFNVPDQLDDATPFREQLLSLKACADALHQFRLDHQLVGQHRPDFMLCLNDKGKLESIEKIEKNAAHQLVEEAMLATNQCAGNFLAQHQAGLFNTHPGYREERREDIEKLLNESLGDEHKVNTSDLDNFIATIQHLRKTNQHLLLSKQQRFLQSSELDLKPAPHFGLGVEYYATITSPIRRFQDLYNHRIMHAILANKKPVKLRQKQLERLKETISNNRNAVRAVEQWLTADYLQTKVGETFTGNIALLTNQGIGVRLSDTGIEGFIVAQKEDKNSPEKPYDKISYNNQRMELTWNGIALDLDQEVEVTLIDVDTERKKPVFEWVNRPQHVIVEKNQ